MCSGFVRVLLLFFVSMVALQCARGPVFVDVRDAARLGPGSSLYEIVVFSDFQCPFCLRTAGALKKLQEAHPKEVTLYFKHFPLPYHPQSERAARAAEAAKSQGKFWEMHDLLFSHAASLRDDIYAELAAELGLEVERFVADMNSSIVTEHLAKDRADGLSAGLDGTPFILLNGIPYNAPYTDLVYEVESDLGAE